MRVYANLSSLKIGKDQWVTEYFIKVMLLHNVVFFRARNVPMFDLQESLKEREEFLVMMKELPLNLLRNHW